MHIACSDVLILDGFDGDRARLMQERARGGRRQRPAQARLPAVPPRGAALAAPAPVPRARALLQCRAQPPAQLRAALAAAVFGRAIRLLARPAQPGALQLARRRAQACAGQPAPRLRRAAAAAAAGPHGAVP